MTELVNAMMERGVLGAVLLNNAVYHDLRLHADLFAVPVHRETYRAISAIIGGGGVADLVTVSAKVGNPGEVAAMTTDASINAAYYVDQLRELYRKRKLDAMARGIAARIGEASSGDIMAYCDAELLSAAEETTGGYRPLADYLKPFTERLEEAHKSGRTLTGVPTGLLALDKLTNGFQRSDVIIIAARPSVGKTALALHMAGEMMIDRVRVGIFSAEMAAEQLVRRMVSKITKIEAARLQNGNVTNAELAKVVEANASLYDARIFVNERSNIRIDELVHDARQMKRRENVDVLFVDYLGLVTHDGNRAIPRHEQIAEISRRLKGLARELAVPVVVLSQLTRDTEGKRPTLASLRDSGAVEQDADVVIMLHPTGGDESMQQLELIVAKHRNGPTGDIPVVFNRRTMSFHARDFRHE